MENEKTDLVSCCVATTEKELGQTYWDSQYQNDTIGWDLGEVSPPLKNYIDQLERKDLRILIPGCGNSYEAEYLLNQGFTDVTLIDISPTVVEKLQKKFLDYPNLKIGVCDFFEHQGEYDLILEQTFFCALNPSLRNAYVAKMYDLLSEKGKLVGLLFNKNFTFEGPPFGGTKCQYTSLFSPHFELKIMENCHNSIEKRKTDELFIHFIKI